MARLAHARRQATLMVRLLYADEVPVAGEIVQFTPKDQERFTNTSIVTDIVGRFNISIPKGAAGELIIKKWFSTDQSQNCPKLEKLLGAPKSGVHKVT